MANLKINAIFRDAMLWPMRARVWSPPFDPAIDYWFCVLLNSLSDYICTKNNNFMMEGNRESLNYSMYTFNRVAGASTRPFSIFLMHKHHD